MRLPGLNESSGLRYFTFFYLYIMQGIPAGFALTALSNYLAAKSVSPQQIGSFIAVVGLPWTIQFIWGPIIDRFQYSGIGHRKNWVVLAQFAAVFASSGILLVEDPVHQLSLLSLVFFMHSIFASIQDASVDAMAISIVPADERGRINGFMRGGFLLGMAFGSAGLSYVMHEHGFRSAALLQTSVLASFAMLTFFIKVDRKDHLLPKFFDTGKPVTVHEKNPELRFLFRKIYTGITNKKSLGFFLMIALVYLGFSIFIRSYSYHLIHVLNWSDQRLSFLQGGWGTVISFIAIITGGIISDRMGARPMQIKVMWGVGLFLILINALFFLWKYELFSGAGLVLWSLADPLFSVAAFPILMALCVDKVEGSQFTAYMALINLCDVAGSYITGLTVTMIPAPALGLSCGCMILVLVLILTKSRKFRLLPTANAMTTSTQ